MSLLAGAMIVGAGCGGGEKGADAEVGKSAPTGEGKLSGKLEVMAFKGGYGIDFYEQAAKEFAEKHPGLDISVKGGPRVWEELRPRFVAGNPPDLVFPGWDFDHWALASEGGLLELSDALKSKPDTGEGTWGDTFAPDILKLGQLDGKQYALPLYVMLYGWWYDPAVFDKNGWTPPKTYAELLSLGEKMKAKGIAPLTYQGQYPYYMVAGMLIPWARSVGGAEAVNAAQNLEPGAWKSEAFVKAASMIKELQTKGYLQQGATAMSHTESQQEMLNGKAAMIPCGTWLESEMKKSMKPGQRVAFFAPPVVEGGKGDPTALLIGIEPWMVPTAGKNPDAAVAFFRYMTSLPKAQEFVRTKGTLMAIKGADDVELPEVLKAPQQAFSASGDMYALQFRHWYKAFDTEIQNALTAMLNGELTPEQFCDRVEAAAEKTRQDSSIKKYKL